MAANQVHKRRSILLCPRVGDTYWHLLISRLVRKAEKRAGEIRHVSHIEEAKSDIAGRD